MNIFQIAKIVNNLPKGRAPLRSSSGTASLERFASCKKISKLSDKQEIYVVGGAIRDLVAPCGKETHDIDFTLNKNPLTLAKKLADFIKGTLVILDDANKIYRVIKKNGGVIYTFDFTKFKGKTIADDLSNRDITINAMAVSLSNLLKFSNDGTLRVPLEIVNRKTEGKTVILDPHNGRADIKNKRIKLISEKSILDDPLRMLRVYRFSAMLNFKIEPSAETMIKKHSALINSVPAERIRDEIFKIFAVPDSADYIWRLDRAGLLAKIFPEITSLKKSARKFYFHPQGLWHHLTEALLSLEDVLSALKKYFPKNHKQLSEHLNENVSSNCRAALLKYITIMHDIGKPSCVKKIKKRVRFFGHEVVGTKLFETVSRRIKLSNSEIAIGKNLIKNHMRILQLVGTHSITARATFRLMREAGENIILLSLLSLSDAMSYRKLPGFEKNNIKDVLKYVRKIIRTHFEKKEQHPRKKIIDGHMLMKQLNLKPGPIVGKLLSAIDEEYNLNRIKTTQEAISFAKTNLKKFKNGCNLDRRNEKTITRPKSNHLRT